MQNRIAPETRAPLSFAVARQIDLVCDQFEQAWQAGTAQPIEEYLRTADAFCVPALREELLRVELHWRFQRGEQPRTTDYLGRFPECAGALPHWLEEAATGTESTPRAPLPAVAPSTVSRLPLTTAPTPAMAEPTAPTLPAVLGEYDLLEQIGAGGMGEVYRARHRRLGKMVALKVILPTRLTSPNALARFRREVEAVGQLDHPHLVEAYDAGEQDGVVYLVLKLIEGIDLYRLVQQRGPLPAAEACDLVRQAALGLQHLHERGLVHRDIKPSNLMRTPAGTVKVLDLGLARLRSSLGAEELTTPNMVMGTPDYLAPEQIDDAAAADIRADLYGLGATLYYLLTGKAPFAHHQDALAKLKAHGMETVQDVRALRPEVPESVAALVARLLAKQPEQRFATPQQLADALASFTTTVTTSSYPQARRRKLLSIAARLTLGGETRSRRKRVGCALQVVAVGLLLVSMALGSTLWLLERPLMDSLMSSQQRQEAGKVEPQATYIDRHLEAAEFEQAMKKVGQLEQQIDQHWEVGEFEQALKAAEELAALWQTVQGADHWQAVDAHWQRKTLQSILQQEEALQRAMARVKALEREADTLASLGRTREEQPLREQVLNIHRKLLGEDNPLTAASYYNLAGNQYARGRYAEAEGSYQRALELRRKLLGEEHPDTATSYNNLALDQYAQSKYAEAEQNLHKALEMRRRLLGEEHPDTATSYNNLALDQYAQGEYAEAQRNFLKALDLRRKLLGEEHSATAQSYNNLALSQNARGQYAEAEQNYRKALDLRQKLLGEEYPATAQSYNNLAYNQNAQRKYAEAEQNLRKTLELYRKLLGEEYAGTIASYDNLAISQSAQGKYAEADQNFRKVLELRHKLQGEEHPDTATSYNNLAGNLEVQGKHAEAERNYRKALELFHKSLGKEHLNTALGYNNLAHNLNAQGQYTEAERLWTQSADLLDRTRLWIAASGLEHATITSKRSPLLDLAAVLARNGKAQLAWRRYEQSLARGTGDDLAQRRHLSSDDVARRAQLLQQLDRLDRQLEHTFTGKDTLERKQKAEELLGQRLHVQQELGDSVRQLEQQYGPVVGQVLTQADIQKALPADAALLGWVDLNSKPKAADANGEHWAVLLRSQGEAVWVPLAGSGPNQTWIDADNHLPDDLVQALRRPKSEWQSMAWRLREQRLEPLAKFLAAGNGLPDVQRIIVLPSTLMDGVPVDLLVEGLTVSYAPSGSLFAYLHGRPRPSSQGLFALADPDFDLPWTDTPPAKLPPGGLLLDVVAPGSKAAKAGVQRSDVLLRYADTELTSLDDLAKAIQAHAQDTEVALTLWRNGDIQTANAQPGKLGVVVARDPAPKALADRRQFEQQLAQARSADDGDWPPLPGTRIEAESLRKLFANRQLNVKLLTDFEASEQALDYLSRKGDLGKFRFLHLATHGLLDRQTPLRSALILSRDHLPDPDKQLAEGLPLYDGKLTAAEVLRDWHLDAELVTLSACETALGKYEIGESFIGFPQALLQCGARSVCVSLWKVNDTATALLMTRFYQNVLGARDGLKKPLGKAAALAEAKTWLRTLPRSEALQLAAQMTGGVERGKGRPALPRVPAVPETAKDEPPYAHPYYWAAFVLVGDPD
jgi:serine/threonine protein kinase/Flp pilus assembly protein TadD